MVSAFFALLARANPRPELRWWARAWAANLVALVVTAVWWLLQSASLFPIVTLLYVAGKTAFALLLAQGAWTMIRPGGRLFTTRQLAGDRWRSIRLAPAIVLRDLTLGGHRAAFDHGRAPDRAGVHAAGVLTPRASPGWLPASRCAAYWLSARRARTSFNGSNRSTAWSRPWSVPPARSCRRAPRSTWGRSGWSCSARCWRCPSAGAGRSRRRITAWCSRRMICGSSPIAIR